MSIQSEITRITNKRDASFVAVANKGGSIGAYTEVLKLINYINDIMNEYESYK